MKTQAIGLVNSSSKDWLGIPSSASCPNCGAGELRVVTTIASHRLSDEQPEQPYAVMLVLECACGKVFSRERVKPGGETHSGSDN